MGSAPKCGDPEGEPELIPRAFTHLVDFRCEACLAQGDQLRIIRLIIIDVKFREIVRRLVAGDRDENLARAFNHRTLVLVAVALNRWADGCVAIGKGRGPRAVVTGSGAPAPTAAILRAADADHRQRVLVSAIAGVRAHNAYWTSEITAIASGKVRGAYFRK